MENQAHEWPYNPKHCVTIIPFAASAQNVHILPKWSQPWDIYPPVSAEYVLCRRELEACAKISSLCKMPGANKRHPNLLCVQVKTFVELAGAGSSCPVSVAQAPDSYRRANSFQGGCFSPCLSAFFRLGVSCSFCLLWASVGKDAVTQPALLVGPADRLAGQQK